MYDSSDLRKGLKIVFEDQPYLVVEAQFVKPGKGQAFTRTKLKHLRTGGVVERNIRSGEKFDAADVEDREMQFLYKEGEDFIFMDQSTYDQVHIAPKVVDDAWQWMKDNLVVQVTFLDGLPISVSPPNFVELKITKCDPGVRGDTATNVTKPATVETGAIVPVPLFVNEGDTIKIDTRNGQYMARV